MKSSAEILLIALLSGFTAYSQTHFYQSVNWEKSPVVHMPSAENKNEDLIIVFEKNYFEVAYDTDGQAAVYETSHILYHVNSVKGIDAVNKGYIPLRNVNEEIDVKARTITPDNKVIFFNKSTIKNVDNFENAGAYKIFAIDGVEVGCDVEMIYTNKKQYYAYSYNVVSSGSRILNYECRIISPKNLWYEVKCYNGLNNFKRDTSDNTKNQLFMSQKNIDKNKNEKYAVGRPNLKAFIFQLTYNYDKGNSKIYNWEIISKEFYNSVYVVEASEQKSITKFIDKYKIIKQSSSEKKIKELESFIKTNFEINDNFDNNDIGKSLETKKIGSDNVIKLYISAFKTMSIPFELVLTSLRDEFKFDPKFPSYIYTREYVFYFPEIDKYLSPIDINSRLGYPNPYLLNNDGLFIKEVNIGDISSASSKTKNIKYTDYTRSYHNSDITINLDFSTNTVKLNVTQKLFGYSAYNVQPIYRYFNEEQKEETKKSFFLSENAENVKDFQILNTEEKNVFVDPMIIKFTAEQNDYLENAGNKHVFKIGLMIGKQEELYQEASRAYPADMNFIHLLKRELIVNIPDGYAATNLSDIVMKKVCTIDGKEAAIFNSSYEIKGNQIVISVYEDYKQIEYSVQNFDDFMAVINAAADFNKKNIIFDKK